MGHPAKGRADYLELGDYNARCYECGAKYKASELVQHWQGYMVCPRCYEPRQSQDFVRGTQDVQTVPWSQNVTDTFVYFCGPLETSAVAGTALAGCARAGYVANDYVELLSGWQA